MTKPQQPEIARTRLGEVDESAAKARHADGPMSESGNAGPVPEANRPGHHPEQEQDKPDLEAFRERMANPASAQVNEGSSHHGLVATLVLASVGLTVVAFATIRRAIQR